MPDSIQGSLAKRVKALRAEKGLTQERLADASGLHVTYIAGIESGRRNPSLKSLAALARGFGIAVAELLEGVGVA
ncbi:MAG TPA: helix-turn-helix transcriptional regulator [Fimbriimonadaceae bacterium]|nr:helix-turn-helix transcriptional regulator [Fimbriimonadaceae bacterium]